ncbi:MAG: phosphoenolpyruvate synthase [Candidatus Buchananbacteria bacterium]|nr:phosphoenolpyruvate synthase [Candidatus Buchananbacteria bacterium]
MPSKNILWFNQTTIKDIPKVGGKNASLGEMYQKLTAQGVRVPSGFAVTAFAYNDFLRYSKIKKDVFAILKKTTKDNLSESSKAIKRLILKSEFSDKLKDDISLAYKKLSAQYKMARADVAVRSSATAEDLPTASFAGQQESYLNISGDQQLFLAIKKCFASLFSDRAISYRIDQKFKHEKVAISVAVQKMVRSDLATSGVMFTIDTESGNSNVILINAAYGLGEYVVKGKVNPDEYYVFKETLNKGFKPITSRQIGDKASKLVYSHNPQFPTKDQKVEPSLRLKYALSDKEILILAKWGVIIEKHYKRPMDIEWAKDGQSGKLFIVQARPETVGSQKNLNVLEEYHFLEKTGEPILSGDSVGVKIGAGLARVIKSPSQLNHFKEGEVLVADMTDPDWEPIMKKASAIVTNAGGRTCHAAIVSRELGVPCVVGTHGATRKIKTGQAITVSCSEGEVGKVYNKNIKFEIKRTNLKNLSRPKTKIMMNVGNPYAALSFSFIPSDGVGLAREEFIISNYIKVHPLALLNFSKLKDEKAKKAIEALTANHKNKPQFFVDKLAEGVGMIAAAFYPKPVIIRLSDFKSNEYANLIGGAQFEPIEPNPMIGWRGASRYYSDKYKKAFILECQALKKAREEFGLKNIKIMIPFCRTVAEGKQVIGILKDHGLKQGQDGLEIYVMCEIPSNVILADEFCKIFDGFSIGSNDLTQLALGVDRDSELVSHVYDENNEAVKKLIAQVIVVAKNHKRKIGICGQAPSDFPDFARFLVRQKIDSISLVPDTVIKTTLAILSEEKRGRKPRKNRK